jgi:hypothetical protein
MTATADDSRDRQDIGDLLQHITSAWREARYDDLLDAFHPRIVFSAPGFQARLEGREACIESYREFVERATVTEYVQSEPRIDTWSGTAVASCQWRMTWAAAGSTHSESGHDVFVFTRAADSPRGWRAVWRTIVVGAPG